MIKFLLACGLIVLGLGCQQASSETAFDDKGDWGAVMLQSAQNFSLDTLQGQWRLSVRTPWSGADSVLRYYRGAARATDGIVLPDTIRRIACLSSTHIAFLEALEATDRLVGVGAVPYSAAARDLPSFATDDGAIHYEALLRLAPDVVLVYGLDDLSAFRRMQSLGLRPVLIEEFREDTPLGRAEWLRFVGALVGEAARADQLFAATRQRYESLKMEAAKAAQRPTVMTGMPFQGTWYVPAGRSFVAQYIQDAGGAYVWSDAPGELSLALGLEAVLERAHDAAIWIDQGVVFSKAEMQALDERFANFTAFQRGELYNYTARYAPNGSFDIYESAVVHPDWVLADLVHIFQPAVLPQHSLYYYQRLE